MLFAENRALYILPFCGAFSLRVVIIVAAEGFRDIHALRTGHAVAAAGAADFYGLLYFFFYCLDKREIRFGKIQCHLDKDNIAVRILFTASKHFVYSLFFYI